MKRSTKLLSALFIAAVAFTSCESDDDAVPVAINEGEVITTVIVQMDNVTNPGANNNVTLTSTDLDGPDAPNAPVFDVQGTLTANTTYDVSVRFLNEQNTPAEEINDEIRAEDDEHEVFYGTTIPGFTVTKTDLDRNGNPLGLEADVTTGAAGTGSLTVLLRHKPTKPNNGTPADAGGDTDIEVTFQNVTVQ